MAVDTNIDFTNFEKGPCQWFVNQAQALGGLRYFLAHDDDGVIWGYVIDGQLKLSGEAFGKVAVPLRAITLQQARLFDGVGELLVWRGNDGWHGRFLSDDGADPEDILSETHRLWGTASDPPGPKDGFTLMRDGTQGLLHAPPVKLPDPEPRQNRRAELCVRHYLKYDEQGQAYIALSRLVSVQEGGK